MATWSTATTVHGTPESVLTVLTDPEACSRWSPVGFELDELDEPRLITGSRARVGGRIAGREASRESVPAGQFASLAWVLELLGAEAIIETGNGIKDRARIAIQYLSHGSVERAHVYGLSLGGMIAQQLAADHPEMVRRIILTGTGPRGGEGMVFEELSADELDDEVGLIMNAFFTQSEPSKTAGRAYLERLKLRADNPDAPVSKQAARAELAAIREWGVIPKTDRFAVLGQIHHPTLVVHGSKDVVVIPINAFLLAQHLPNAQLIMYPDASHGAYSQYAENFLENARLFFNG